MTPKQYRKVLSILRARINIVERLMSENRWDEIEFDKIPSRAGFIYRNAFARHDLEREKSDRKVITYAEFAKDTTTTVNAKTLYPYECVAEVFENNPYWMRASDMNETTRAMINKYWDNLADYINGAEFNGIAVVDTSGSMIGTPMNVALSLGMYCAEKAKGPYHNHFITFSGNPSLVEIEGVDFVDKVLRMSSADWGMNTNVKGVFDLLLRTAVRNHCTQDEIPQNVIVISDMEFDACSYQFSRNAQTLFEQIEREWNQNGYKMPHLVFWNVNARQNNIPMQDKDGISFVSGFSPVLYEQIMKGKTATALMYDKLDSERYKPIG